MFSPVAAVLDWVATQYGWNLYSIDVSTAFLRGLSFKELEELGITRKVVAFIPPPDLLEIWGRHPKGKVWRSWKWDEVVCRMLKGGYGLKDAPFLWYLRFAGCFVKELNMKALTNDACFFIPHYLVGLVPLGP